MPRCRARAVERQPVTAVAAEFAGRDVERDADVVAGLESRALDRVDQHLERLLVARERPASSRPRRRRRLQRPRARISRPPRGRFRRPLEPSAKDSRAERHHHEVLHVDTASRVRAAAEDLDLGQRQSAPASRRPVPPQRQPACAPAAACSTASDVAIGALPPSRDLSGVPSSAISARRSPADRQRRARRARAISLLTAATRARHVEAAEPRPAVAQVDRLARTARCAGRRDAAAERAAAQRNVDLDGRPAARVPDPPRRALRDRGVRQLRPPPCVPRSRRPLPSAATSASTLTGSQQQPRGDAADHALSASPVMYSAGDLPSTRPSSNPGSSCAVRDSSPRRSPSRRR